MHFERRNAFQNAYFFLKKNDLKICVPTLPKMFRSVAQNTLNFFIWPNIFDATKSTGIKVP